MTDKSIVLSTNAETSATKDTLDEQRDVKTLEAKAMVSPGTIPAPKYEIGDVRTVYSIVEGGLISTSRDFTITTRSFDNEAQAWFYAGFTNRLFPVLISGWEVQLSNPKFRVGDRVCIRLQGQKKLFFVGLAASIMGGPHQGHYFEISHEIRWHDIDQNFLNECGYQLEDEKLSVRQDIETLGQEMTREVEVTVANPTEFVSAMTLHKVAEHRLRKMPSVCDYCSDRDLGFGRFRLRDEQFKDPDSGEWRPAVEFDQASERHPPHPQPSGEPDPNSAESFNLIASEPEDTQVDDG